MNRLVLSDTLRERVSVSPWEKTPRTPRKETEGNTSLRLCVFA